MNKEVKGIAKRVAKEAKLNSNRVHIISRLDGKWAVKKEGKIKAHKVLTTQKEAIGVGKKLVKDGKASQIVIHKRNGKF